MASDMASTSLDVLQNDGEMTTKANPEGIHAVHCNASKDAHVDGSNGMGLTDEDPEYKGNPNLYIVSSEDEEEEEEKPFIKTKDKTPNKAKEGGPAQASEAANAEDEDGEGPDSRTAMGQPTKSKRKKRKPKSKRGLNAPSGFEEYYVDPPVTPAEHEEEKGLYDNELLFSQRIETAIQRFCFRRRLDSTRKDVFDKYLAYGGINCGQKAFSGGLDQTTLSNYTSQEIAAMTATHFVPLDREDADMYGVDFEGCAKAFFSSRMPAIFDLCTAEGITTRTRTIKNFLNYLLHHDVAPEYRQDIYAARAVCDQAEEQLCKIRYLNRLLPGRFQTACSEVFGGNLRGLATHPDQDWDNISTEESTTAKSDGMDDLHDIGIVPEKAKQTFAIGLAAQADDEIFKRYEQQSKAGTIHTARVIPECGLEITDVVSPDDEIKTLYRHPRASGVHPVGKVLAKKWYPPSIPHSTSSSPPPDSLSTKDKTQQIFTFVIESRILPQFFRGMKLIATVREMSFGIMYFDVVHGAFCSFYDELPNGLMMDNWVEPGEDLPYRDKKKEQSAGADDGEGAVEEGGQIGGEEAGEYDGDQGGGKLDMEVAQDGDVGVDGRDVVGKEEGDVSNGGGMSEDKGLGNKIEYREEVAQEGKGDGCSSHECK